MAAHRRALATTLVMASSLVALAGRDPRALALPPVKADAADVRMTVKGVRQLEGRSVVLLVNDKGDRVLPIFVGPAEAEAITMRLDGRKPPRPMTHDLLQASLAALGAQIERVEVDELRSEMFIGKLVLKNASGRVERIDARPSDLIALAVAAQVPILVARQVLNRAGIRP